MNHARASIWVSRYGTCRAIDQLYAVQQRGLTWESELSGAVQRWEAQGVRLLAVANRSDCTFNPPACGLVWMTDGTRDQLVPVAGPGVNLVVDTVTDLISHDAALYSADVVLAIANAVGYQAT